MSAIRTMLGSVLALAACGAAASTASGDGLPVPFDGGDNAGVASRDGDFRYATVAAGGDTAVVKIAAGSATLTTVESRKTTVEPRIVAISVRRCWRDTDRV